jgi:hypothetical protein
MTPGRQSAPFKRCDAHRGRSALVLPRRSRRALDQRVLRCRLMRRESDNLRRRNEHLAEFWGTVGADVREHAG